MSTHGYRTALVDIQRKSTKKIEVLRHGRLQKFGDGDATVFHMVDFLDGKVYTVNSNNMSTAIAFERYFKMAFIPYVMFPKVQMMVIEKHCTEVNAVRTIYAVCGHNDNVHICIPSSEDLRELRDLCNEFACLSEVEVTDHGLNSDIEDFREHWGQLREALDSYSINGIMQVNKMYGVLQDLGRAIPRAIEKWNAEADKS